MLNLNTHTHTQHTHTYQSIIAQILIRMCSEATSVDKLR